MTKVERTIIAEELFEECKTILDGKGIAYSGPEDVNDNFKRNAKLLGMSKYQVLSVYMNKHLDSIHNAIKENPYNPVEKTEGMRGRIADAINYLVILEAMLKEDKLWEDYPALKTNPKGLKWNKAKKEWTIQSLKKKP